MVYAGPIFYPGDRAGELLRVLPRLGADAPDEITTLVNLTTAPPAPFIPEAVHGKPIVAVIAVHAGEPEQGRALVQPLKDLGDPIADLIGVMPYTMMQSLLDGLWTRGAHNYSRSAYVDELTDGRSPRPSTATGRCRPPAPRSTSTISAARWRKSRADAAFGDLGAVRAQRDRAARRTPTASTRASSGRATPPARWPRSAATAPTSTSWATPATSGCATSYGDAEYERLVALKRRYDPTNLFHLNQNIAP